MVGSNINLIEQVSLTLKDLTEELHVEIVLWNFAHSEWIQFSIRVYLTIDSWEMTQRSLGLWPKGYAPNVN